MSESRLNIEYTGWNCSCHTLEHITWVPEEDNIVEGSERRSREREIRIAVQEIPRTMRSGWICQLRKSQSLSTDIVVDLADAPICTIHDLSTRASLNPANRVLGGLPDLIISPPWIQRLNAIERKISCDSFGQMHDNDTDSDAFDRYSFNCFRQGSCTDRAGIPTNSARNMG
jgi:hypothetical protein